MITIKSLDVSYGKQSVICDLNIDFESAQIHGIVGLNGAGKTTFFNTIYGIKTHTNGKIYFNNEILTKRNIAYLEHHNYFYPNITGNEYLELFKIRNTNFNIKEWNDIFKLPLDKLVDTYSVGMRKKLAFLGVLALQKPILILDEPFNGIDLETNQNIKSILHALKENGRTIILSSHILDTLVSICDTISRLNNGQIDKTLKRGNFDNIEEDLFTNEHSINKQKINSLI